MSKALSALSERAREKAKKAKTLDWRAPMLATLEHDPFFEDGWIYERKLDGERCFAYYDGDEVTLYSRNEKKINKSYPEIAEALAKEGGEPYIADGEIVAFEGKRTSFSKLQQRMHASNADEAREGGVAVYYYLFDLIQIEDQLLRDVPLLERKKALRSRFSFKDPLRYTSHRSEDGEAYFEEARKRGWEGLIAKKADAGYASGRSRNWLKFKCGKSQELVIGGYTDPGGSRVGFGALLLGYFRDGDFVYAGKVGTGFDDETLEGLRKRMDKRKRERSPFEGEVKEKATWLKPELVAEIGFTEWTDDGRLRHPRFLGLRRDKKAKEVTREGE